MKEKIRKFLDNLIRFLVVAGITLIILAMGVCSWYIDKVRIIW